LRSETENSSYECTIPKVSGKWNGAATFDDERLFERDFAIREIGNAPFPAYSG
jgi:hypothetical protein